MFLNAAMSAALDRIAERAADVRQAYTPGALPQHDDVATPAAASDFTLDPLAVAAPDGAYFVTTDSGGNVAYTRDGSFAVREGGLVDEEGRSVCGIRRPGEAPAALRVDPIDASLGRVDGIAIERDGSFVYRRAAIDPRTGAREWQRVVVGRIVLAQFPAGTRLTGKEGAEFRPPPNLTPQLGTPGDGVATLMPQRRERSRVDIDRSLIRLKEAYVAFDALQAAEFAKARAGKTAMDLVK